MTQPKVRILYVDDEPAYCRLFCRGMEDDERFIIETAESGEEALRKLAGRSTDIVLTDLLMPRMNGLELLETIRSRYPEVFVLMLTGVDSTAEAVRAMKAGAYDYILKPLDMEMLQRKLTQIVDHLQLLKERSYAELDEFRFENLIGKDQVMFEVYEKIRRVAQTEATVLITGESGTGKELIAEAIHARSNRREKPLIRVNCASLTETLINSALFGHEKGAFTGATTRTAGFFEAASGGTIFLDEIGDIPVQTQVALLRVLEMGNFQRVGSTETTEVDARVICATNRDLSLAVKEKLFREDLYYRINVITLVAPPLRTRKSDIPLLAEFLLAKYARRAGRERIEIARSAMNVLCDYDWPGNVRELANAIERAVVFCPGRKILKEHLPEEVQRRDCKNFEVTLHDPSLTSAEATLIRAVLEEKNWNLKQAADLLGIARGTLYKRMEKYGISPSP